MQQNNYVYKGYRLIANLSRMTPAADAVPSSPFFTATIRIVQANAIQDDGDEYDVPYFANGGIAYSPNEAIDIAIKHGCDIVAAWG